MWTEETSAYEYFRNIAKQNKYVSKYSREFIKAKGLWDEFMEFSEEKWKKEEEKFKEEYNKHPYPIDF